ncbi:MAG: endonuclease III [Candidatus Cloacimonadota bacterium]|nr:MAG: endonuclease III [Candidatus Cloacimonadota bacterium]
MDLDKIIKILGKRFKENKTPVVDLIEIQTNDPFKVLTATILSARTKDETTSEVIKRLFKKVKSADDFLDLETEEIEKLIFPAGFFRNKAKYLKKLPVVLNEKFGGVIPEEIDDLIKLPGVGRKTANLVRTIAFKKDAMCVDIHVHRISNRWGYVKTKTPFETEMALRKKLPKKYWDVYNSYLVSFGQNHCRPINPKCSTCPIYDECARVGVTSSR